MNITTSQKGELMLALAQGTMLSDEKVYVGRDNTIHHALMLIEAV